jgi:hypothetical protein
MARGASRAASEAGNNFDREISQGMRGYDRSVKEWKATDKVLKGLMKSEKGSLDKDQVDFINRERKALLDYIGTGGDPRKTLRAMDELVDKVRAISQNLGPVPTFAMRDNDPDRIEALYDDEKITTVTAFDTDGKEMKSFAIMVPSESEKTLYLGDRFEFTHEGRTYNAKIDRRPDPVNLGTGIRSIVEFTPDITVLRVDRQIFERPRAMTNREIKDISRGLPEV